MATCKIQKSKKKVIRSMNCIFLGSVLLKRNFFYTKGELQSFSKFHFDKFIQSTLLDSNSLGDSKNVRITKMSNDKDSNNRSLC